MANQLKPTKHAAQHKGFGVDECKMVTGDARTRTIEAKARADADSGVFDAPKPSEGGSYWSQVTKDMERIVYVNAHGKRLERIERMKNKDLVEQ